MRGAKSTVKIRETVTRSAEETLGLGRRLGGMLGGGDVVALVGPLGVGKTVLAKGIGMGLGVEEELLSPSFNIVLEYEGRLPLRHIDFYRLGASREATEMGMEEYLDGGAVKIVEWADRLPGMLPRNCLEVEMSFGKADLRKIFFKPQGAHYVEIVDNLFKRD